MQEDIYRMAISALRRHLAEAGVTVEFDDGDLRVGGHRLSLAVASDGIVKQGANVICPLDIQIHLDGDEGDKFRVGTLGVGADLESAAKAGVAEWHVLAAAPLLAALGGSLDLRRGPRRPMRWGDWSVFPGRAIIRGPLPPELQAEGALLRSMLQTLRELVLGWAAPPRSELRSMFLMATSGPDGPDIQAAVNGFVDAGLAEKLAMLPWPRPAEAFFYKQLLVLRGGEEGS
jgi:hypothetical protein